MPPLPVSFALNQNVHLHNFQHSFEKAVSRPKASGRARSAQRHVVIADNGNPTALMIDIADNNLEEVLAAVRQAQAMRALKRLQADSLRKGLDGLTEEDIEAEIAAARKERKRKNDVANSR